MSAANEDNDSRSLVSPGHQDHLTLRELHVDLLNTLMEATQLAEEGWSRVPSDARAALACEQIEGLKAIFRNSLTAAATIDWPADTRLADSVAL